MRETNRKTVRRVYVSPRVEIYEGLSIDEPLMAASGGSGPSTEVYGMSDRDDYGNGGDPFEQDGD